MSKVDETVAELIGKDLTLCRDYASIVNWSVSKIEKWAETWTDYSITDPGILFINADAYLYDILNYVLDEAFLNNILRYTKSLESLYIMSKFAGLDLPGYYCSEAKVLITNDEVRYPVTIPKDYELYIKDFSTGEEFHFYSLEEQVLLYGSSKYFKFLEGERQEINTVFEEFDEYNQFIIPSEKVGLNTISVLYEDGEGEWQDLVRVKDALLNLSNELCYSAHYAFNKTIIKLTPGIWEYFNNQTKIKIIYGIPGGINANVGEVTPEPKSHLYVMEVDVSSKLKYKIKYASGASIPYDLEHTRVYIGNNTWRSETLLISADFNQLTVDKFPDVIRFAVEQEQGIEEMKIYFLPKEGLTAEEISKLYIDIKDYTQDLMFGGTQLSVDEIKLRGVSFELEATLGINSSNLEVIEQRINEILERYLDRETQPVGMLLRRSAVIAQIEDEIPEVLRVAVISPISDSQVSETECFVLNNVSITFVQKVN